MAPNDKNTDAAAAGAAGRLEFSINGERHSLDAAQVDPSTTLNTYLRRSTRFKATKLACGEGGCGACTVDVARFDADGKEAHIAATSCLLPLAACHGAAVTTNDGLGSTTRGLHQVQERLAKHNGLQCGFCTSGVVMNMYSAAKRCDDGASLSMDDVEKHVTDGNLCRCTGYRPLLDACKSLCKDSDIEDLVCKSAPKGGYDASKDPVAPAFLKSVALDSARFTADGRTWLRCATLAEAHLALAAHSAPGSARAVVANTSVGVYKEQPETTLVDISQLPELRTITSSAERVTIGGAVSVDRFIAALRSAGGAFFAALADGLLRVASTQLRTTGSVAGNLVMAKRLGFLSDVATALLAADAQVTIEAADNARRTQSVEEFLNAGAAWTAGDIVVELSVANRAGDGVRFVFYKTALRPSFAHAYANAAIVTDVKDGKIAAASVAFGGVGGVDDEPGTHAVRGKATEAALVGKEINADTLAAAMAAAAKDAAAATASDKVSRGAWRVRLVQSFVYKHLIARAGSSVDQRMRSAAHEIAWGRPLSSGKQDFVVVNDIGPVQAPISKLNGPALASGEAKFTDDFPVQEGTLHAAYVLANKASAKITKIDTSAALDAPGVKRVIEAKDIPGKNNCSALGQDFPVFAEGVVQYHSMPLAMVLADTAAHAWAAAKLCTVGLDDGGVKPVLTIAQALEQPKESMHVLPVVNEYKLGDDIDKSLGENKHRLTGQVNVGSQKHFYMEPQSFDVSPDEDGCVVIRCSTQWADAMQGGCATVLGLPINKIKVINRRGGGAFGGRLTHSIQCAAAAAVAALVTGVPVRLTLPREVDMKLVGGREETLGQYDVAFDDKGRISALKFTGYLNAGFTVDLSWFCNFALPSAVNQTYYVPNIVTQSTLIRTAKCSRTAVRGPGEIAASYSMETIIERIAHKLGLPPHTVRETNFYSDDPKDADTLKTPNGKPLTYYTLPKLWSQLKADSAYDERWSAAEEFNKANRFKKRGMAITPVRYEVSVWPKSAIVNVFGDGSVVCAHSCADTGQGGGTKVQQMIAHTLGAQLLEQPQGIDINQVRITEPDSIMIPNQMFTGGSTGSEGAAEAARLACMDLVARLKPVLASVREERAKKAAEKPDDADAKKAADAPVTWGELAAAAKGANVHLSAVGHWSGGGDQTLCYNNYGACVSEVELDVLTGEVSLLRADMLYDCGKSLNPAIDIGQCEGAFMMGVGHMLRESERYDDATGELKSWTTWEYKVPSHKDVPLIWNVKLMENPTFDKGIMSSKASGEPPLVLSSSVGMATRQAIQAARADAGCGADWVNIDAPITPDVAQQKCGVDLAALTL